MDLFKAMEKHLIASVMTSEPTAIVVSGQALLDGEHHLVALLILSLLPWAAPVIL